jgi:chromosome segregation ATPase
MDHIATQLDHMRLRVDEIAARLHVTRRTVYSMIERENWLKEEGPRNKVWYHVPVAFIEEYVKDSEQDHIRSQENIHTDTHGFTSKITQLHSKSQSDTVQVNEELYKLMIGDRDSSILELKETIEARNAEIDDLRLELSKAQQKSSSLEIQLAELRGNSQGKDSLIKAKDDIIQAKEQAINAANAAVMLLEQRNQTLEADEPKKLQGGQAQMEEKKGWFDKILGR